MPESAPGCREGAQFVAGTLPSDTDLARLSCHRDEVRVGAGRSCGLPSRSVGGRVEKSVLEWSPAAIRSRAAPSAS